MPLNQCLECLFSLAEQNSLSSRSKNIGLVFLRSSHRFCFAAFGGAFLFLFFFALIGLIN